MSEITIRRAVPKDFVNILRLLEQAVQENEVAYPPIDELKLMEWVTATKRDGEIVVADLSGRIVGTLGLLVQEWKWSTERFISNEFFFVQPPFRKHGTAEALLKAGEKFAHDGKLRLVVSFSGGRKSETKDRMMQMKGWIYCGGMFTKLPPG